MRRSVRHGLAVVVLATTSVVACLAPAARAELGPIELVSKSPREQAGFAREAALSGDGNYVAFVGELGGKTGIFRKNLTTGALALVVSGAAEAASISADGRFVSFTTTQSLEPVEDPGGSSRDVYVADLAGPAPVYQLASATEGHRLAGSSSAAPRVALSADGSEVAFVDEGEVYVRKVDEEEPILITARRDPVTGEMTSAPVPQGGALTAAGAALSADGNAVAWVGERLPEQVPLLASEEAGIREIEERSRSQIDKSNKYFEPLWRLVPAPGQVASLTEPTRRIVGGGDPLAPGCGGSVIEAACQGPFSELDENHSVRGLAEWEGFGWGTNLPQLSADGRTVATIGSPEDDNDLFVVDMSAGLSRVQAVRQLTRWTNPVPGPASQEIVFARPEYLSFTGPIKQSAISPDGRYIAFTTMRQNFPLAPPTLLTPRPSALPTLVELYQLELTGGTMERITPGPGAGVSLAPGNGIDHADTQAIATARYGEAEWGASGPSYSADGLKLAFASKAYNYVGGDANEESDVFTVTSTPPATVDESKISPRPSALSVLPSWKLTVHAVSRPNGAIRIVAGVPGAGTVHALAKSRVGSRPKSRNVSAGQQRSAAAGLVRLELHLPHKLSNLAHRKGGLYAALDIQFTGPGGKPLEQQIVARFRAHAKTKPKGGKR
jgi:Tol biopolymer transport system component